FNAADAVNAVFDIRQRERGLAVILNRPAFFRIRHASGVEDVLVVDDETGNRVTRDAVGAPVVDAAAAGALEPAIVDIRLVKIGRQVFEEALRGDVGRIVVIPHVGTFAGGD